MNIKDNIRNEALKLFLTRGYNVGINEIIKKSNASKGSFYHHYKSKEQLFVEIIDSYFFGQAGDMDFITDEKINFETKIEKLIKSVFRPYKNLVKILPENEKINYLGVLSEYPKNDVLRQKAWGHSQQILKYLETIVSEAQKEGVIKNTIDVKSYCKHIGMLVDGSLVNSIIAMGDIYMAERECIKAVKQLIELSN